MPLRPSSELPRVDLLFSVLNFNSLDRTNVFLDHVPNLISRYCRARGKTWALIVRNNSPDVHLFRRLGGDLAALPEGTITFVDSDANLGFGIGHNANFELRESDIFVPMNNDIALPDLDFIDTALLRLDDPSVAIVGDRSGSNYLDSAFAFGRVDPGRGEPAYVDGAILLIRSNAFAQLGGFREEFWPAYFEDADLSLRARAQGWKLSTIDISHQHFRSDSSVRLHQAFYSAIFENSRAFFFSRWSKYLRTGQLHRRVFIRFDHDGIGDLLLGIYPLREMIQREARYGFRVVVALRWFDLAFLLGDLPCEVVDSRVARPVIDDLVFEAGQVNMSYPARSIDLLAASMGVSDFSIESAVLRGLLRREAQASAPSLPSRYAAVHFDLQRANFEGKGLAKPHAAALIRRLLEDQEVVLIGQADQESEFDPDYEAMIAAEPRIRDMRGATSLKDLCHIVGAATRFVGIDSAPANIAFAFDVPAFVVYGSVSPETKIYRAKSFGYADQRYSCLGCYHRAVEPSYGICTRRDQACVKKVDELDLLASFETFMNGLRTISLPGDAFARRVRENLMVSLFNPVFRSKLLDVGGLGGKSLSDGILRVLDAVEEQFRGRQADMENEIVRLNAGVRRSKGEAAHFERLLLAAQRNLSENDDNSAVELRGVPDLQSFRCENEPRRAKNLKVSRGHLYNDSWCSAEIVLSTESDAPVSAVEIVFDMVADVGRTIVIDIPELGVFGATIKPGLEGWFAVACINFTRRITTATIQIRIPRIERVGSDVRELGVLLDGVYFS